MHDDHATQLLWAKGACLLMDGVVFVEVVVVLFINEEGTRVQRMLAKTCSKEAVNGFKKPTSWSVSLTIAGLQ